MSTQYDTHRFRGRLVGIGVAAVILAGLVVTAVSWRSPPPVPLLQKASKIPGTHFVVKMRSYHFVPDQMVWTVGERVTITLVNESRGHPAASHEFMVGQGPRKEDTVFGKRQIDGFEVPFFKGVTLEILGGGNLSMIMPGMGKFSGIDPNNVVTNPKHMTMKMASGMSMEMWMSQNMKPEEDMAGGFMPVIKSSGSLTFSFVVPDRPGTWTYGCMQGSGQHFLNGMRGTIVVKPQNSATTVGAAL